MRTLEIINLILLALNFCFFLASNWLINASNDYYRAVLAAENALKEMEEALDKKYDHVSEQYDDIWKQYDRMYEQFKRIQSLWESIHERS